MISHFLRFSTSATCQLSGCRSHVALQVLPNQVSEALGGCFNQLTACAQKRVPYSTLACQQAAVRLRAQSGP